MALPVTACHERCPPAPTGDTVVTATPETDGKMIASRIRSGAGIGAAGAMIALRAAGADAVMTRGGSADLRVPFHRGESKGHCREEVSAPGKIGAERCR